MIWTKDEISFLKKLNTPLKIQQHLDQLVYNPDDSSISPRYVMMTNDGHCFEGGLLAAAALEFHGHPPLMVDLHAENDSHHVICVYKTQTGWGSISKSNTTMLRGRSPVYRSIRELVMSYFDFYFNLEGELSLYAYTDPINLNKFNHWNWRTTDDDLMEMGMLFNDIVHYELMNLKELKRLPRVHPKVKEACFLGADPHGLYQT